MPLKLNVPTGHFTTYQRVGDSMNRERPQHRCLRSLAPATADILDWLPSSRNNRRLPPATARRPASALSLASQ